MDRKEFSSRFDVLYNNATSNQAPGLSEYEKSVILTKAEYELVKSKCSNSDRNANGGFDGSPKRQADFSTIMMHRELSTANSQPFNTNGIDYKYPDDVFVVLNESITSSVTSGGDTITQIYTVKPISFEEYDRLMSKPYKLPAKNMVWRLPIMGTMGGFIEDKAIGAIIPSPAYEWNDTEIKVVSSKSYPTTVKVYSYDTFRIPVDAFFIEEYFTTYYYDHQQFGVPFHYDIKVTPLEAGLDSVVSSDDTIATIDMSGNIVPLQNGTVTFTARKETDDTYLGVTTSISVNFQEVTEREIITGSVDTQNFQNYQPILVDSAAADANIPRRSDNTGYINVFRLSTLARDASSVLEYVNERVPIDTIGFGWRMILLSVASGYGPNDGYYEVKEVWDHLSLEQVKTFMHVDNYQTTPYVYLYPEDYGENKWDPTERVFQRVRYYDHVTCEVLSSETVPDSRDILYSKPEVTVNQDGDIILDAAIDIHLPKDMTISSYKKYYIDTAGDVFKHIDGIVFPTETVAMFEARRNRASGQLFPDGTLMYQATVQGLETDKMVVSEIIGRFPTNASVEYKMRYLRKPLPIILTDLWEIDDSLSIEGRTQVTECELPEEMHEEILQRAVEIAKSIWQGDLKSSVELGQRSE